MELFIYFSPATFMKAPKAHLDLYRALLTALQLRPLEESIQLKFESQMQIPESSRLNIGIGLAFTHLIS